MKIKLVAGLVSALAGQILSAAEKIPSPPATPVKTVESTAAAPVKSLRNLGIHAGRTKTGGTRNQNAGLAAPVVLAPSEVARTISESPVFYWLCDGGGQVSFVFTLTLPRADEPVLEKVVKDQKSEGVYGIDLAALGVKLELDRDYEWSVSTIVRDESSSRDIVSQGRIRRVTAGPEVTAVLAGAPAGARHEIYSRSGLFYDAVAALLPLVEARPDDAKLRADLDGLLATFKVAVVRR